MNDPKPSVAIIIPCFNRWPHVQEAIDSVLAQTWLNTRCIVVDDVSTDDSYARLQEHYGNEPGVEIYRLDSNQGQSAARNHGVELCNADYIGFLDSDDLLVDTAVERRIRLSRKHPEFQGIIFSDRIDEATREPLLPGKKSEGDALSLSEYIDNMGWLHTNSFLMKRESFIGLGGFDRNLRKKEDVEFFLRALCCQEARYAQGPCCMVRSMDNQRARHDHARIIEQGAQFIQALHNDTELMTRLSPMQYKVLVDKDTRSILQALYKSRENTKFRDTLREAISSGKIRPDLRMAKRYLLSFFRNKNRNTHS